MDYQTADKTFALLFIVLTISCNISPTLAQTCSQLCHYVRRARDADCSRRHLRHIPLQCSGSKYLNLDRNNITEIPGGVFTVFHHLKYLQILDSSIQQIGANSFAGAGSLKAVNLLQNELGVIPRHSFNNTESLRWIYLSRNKITSIEEGVFQESSLIEMLYLDDNQMDHFRGDEFRRLSMMQRLLLGGNRLRTLPGGIFVDLVSLDYLDLSRNRLLTLSPNLFTGLTKLGTVKLSGNGLINIVPGTFTMNPITHLDISANDFTTLLWDSAEFAEVEVLEASGNRWFCNCYLDPFRNAVLELSQGVESSVTCAGPESFANTDITSHPTLCFPSSSTKPTLKTTTHGKSVKKAYPKQTSSDQNEVESSSDDHTAMITLLVVAIITVVAVTAMTVFLVATFVIHRMRKREKDIKAKIKNIMIDNEDDNKYHPDNV